MAEYESGSGGWVPHEQETYLSSYQASSPGTLQPHTTDCLVDQDLKLADVIQTPVVYIVN